MPFFPTAAYSNSIQASDFYFKTQTKIIAGILPPGQIYSIQDLSPNVWQGSVLQPLKDAQVQFQSVYS